MRMGKVLYQAYFFARTAYIKRRLSFSFQIWFRNSLFQDYFQFARSDIDVSVLFTTDHNCQKEANYILESLKKDLLIKEIHFYYPLLLKSVLNFANPIELKRDPKLMQLLGPPGEGAEASLAEKTVFLLRMYFANLSHLQRSSFTDRDFKKWQSYYLIAGFPPVTKKEQLLPSMLKGLIDHNENFLKAALFLQQSFLAKKELHHIWEETPYKNETLILMPQLFCFIKSVPEMQNAIEKEIFMAQLSWEVWGMMIQPAQLFDSHLEHLSYLLNEADLRTDKKKVLLENIQAFRAMLTP